MADPPIPYLPIEPGILKNRVVKALRRADPQIGAWVFLHVLMAMGDQDGSRWMHGLLEFDARDLAAELTLFLDGSDFTVTPERIVAVVEAWKQAKRPDRFMVEFEGKFGVKIYWAGFRKRAEPAAINRIRARKGIKSDQAREYLIILFDEEMSSFSSKLHKKVTSRLQAGYCASKVKESKVKYSPLPPAEAKRDAEKKGDKSPRPKRAKRGGSELPQEGIEDRTGEPVRLSQVMTGLVPAPTETEGIENV